MGVAVRISARTQVFTKSLCLHAPDWSSRPGVTGPFKPTALFISKHFNMALIKMSADVFSNEELKFFRGENTS